MNSDNADEMEAPIGLYNLRELGALPTLGVSRLGSLKVDVMHGARQYRVWLTHGSLSCYDLAHRRAIVECFLPSCRKWRVVDEYEVA